MLRGLDDEAMFIHFKSQLPFSVKVFLGPINVISGNKKEDQKKEVKNVKERQDYIVTPTQKWIDGIATGSGQVKQFVATATAIGFVSS